MLATRGRDMPQGISSGRLRYAPDRLKISDDKGEQRRIQARFWDEALDTIAEKLQTIKEHTVLNQ